MPSHFAPHGTLELHLHENILQVEGSGPWNSESLHQSAQLAGPLLEQLLGKLWAVLVIVHGEPVYVPAAVASLVDTLKAEKKQGRVATAVLVNECATPGFARLHLSDIFNQAGETYAFFEDREKALAWLKGQIAGAEEM